MLSRRLFANVAGPPTSPSSSPPKNKIKLFACIGTGTFAGSLGAVIGVGHGSLPSARQMAFELIEQLLCAAFALARVVVAIEEGALLGVKELRTGAAGFDFRRGH